MKNFSVIVNYFSSEIIHPAISLSLKIGMNVVIVDNSSCYSEFNRLRERYGDLERVFLLNPNENLGFGKGCDYGYRFVEDNHDFDFIAFVNPDISEKQCEAFPQVFEEFKKSDYGYFQPLIINEGVYNSIQGLRYSSVFELTILYTIFKRILPRRYLNKKIIKVSDFLSNMKIDIYIPSGAFFVVKRKLLKDIGGFPRDNFLYFEECIFAKRALESGWKGYVDSSVKVSHLVGSTTNLKEGLGSPRMIKIRFKSFITMLKKTSSSKTKLPLLFVHIDYIARILFCYFFIILGLFKGR